MIKFIWKRAFLFLLASMLVGAILVTFNSSNTFAQGGEHQAIEDDGSGGGGGGGSWVCPRLEWCGDFGCRAKSYLDPTQICSRYKIGTGPGTCASPVNCTSN